MFERKKVRCRGGRGSTSQRKQDEMARTRKSASPKPEADGRACTRRRLTGRHDETSVGESRVCVERVGGGWEKDGRGTDDPSPLSPRKLVRRPRRASPLWPRPALPRLTPPSSCTGRSSDVDISETRHFGHHDVLRRLMPTARGQAPDLDLI